MSEIVFFDTQNNILEYVDVINPTKGSLDANNDMLLISDNNPLVPNNGQQIYEIISHKVNTINDSGNTINYPSTSALVEYVAKYNYYRFTQTIASTTWNINHNLNKYPSVVTRNNTGKIMVGEIQYIDENNVIVNFNSPNSGVAEIN